MSTSMGCLCWTPVMLGWVPRLVPWCCPPALAGPVLHGCESLSHYGVLQPRAGWRGKG